MLVRKEARAPFARPRKDTRAYDKRWYGKRSRTTARSRLVMPYSNCVRSIFSCCSSFAGLAVHSRTSTKLSYTRVDCMDEQGCRCFVITCTHVRTTFPCCSSLSRVWYARQGLAAYVASLIDRTLDWDDIKWLRTICGSMKVNLLALPPAIDSIVSVESTLQHVFETHSKAVSSVVQNKNCNPGCSEVDFRGDQAPDLATVLWLGVPQRLRTW